MGSGGRLELVALTDIDDVEEAYRLYLDHGGEHLPVPDPDELLGMAEGDQLFGCRLGDGRLVAAAGTFWVGRCCGAFSLVPIAVYELAGMVVHPDCRGLRPHSVQDLLVALRAAVLAGQQSSGLCLISSVASRNGSSRKSMDRCGLVAIEAVPQWVADLRRSWLAGRRPEVADYILEGAAVPDLLVKLAAAGTVRSRLERPDGTADAGWSVSIAPGLAAAAAGSAKAPLWPAVVPPRRLLGETPPFKLWPR